MSSRPRSTDWPDSTASRAWSGSTSPARTLLVDDLPLVGGDVTVEHLLSHRSGIGDYVDEDAIDDIRDFLLPVPVGRLASTEDYLVVLDGHPSPASPEERFAYCNSGYVILALLAERATGRDLADLVAEHVCDRAGMHATGFLRSDERWLEGYDAGVSAMTRSGPGEASRGPCCRTRRMVPGPWPATSGTRSATDRPPSNRSSTPERTYRPPELRCGGHHVGLDSSVGPDPLAAAPTGTDPTGPRT